MGYRADRLATPGAAGGTAFGTLVAVAPQTIDDAVADRLLRDLTRSPLPGSVWQVGGALMVRIPATAAEQAVSDLTDAWRRLRPLTIGHAATDLPAAFG